MFSINSLKPEPIFGCHCHGNWANSCLLPVPIFVLKHDNKTDLCSGSPSDTEHLGNDNLPY